jgi:hypothetical protein
MKVPWREIAAFLLPWFMTLPASATLQDVADTPYNYDSATGLYWLDISATKYLSSAEAVNVFAPFGWREAAFDEINALLIGNLTTFARDDDYMGGASLHSGGTDDQLKQLVDVLGGPSWSDSSTGSYELYARTGTSVRSGFHVASCLQHYDGSEAFASTSCAELRDTSSPSVGMWMVSAEVPQGPLPAIPEPSSALLVVSGLLALMVFNRRSVLGRLTKKTPRMFKLPIPQKNRKSSRR